MTAVFPYIVLTVLFFRGVTLDGAGTGIEFLFKPDVRTKVYIHVSLYVAHAHIVLVTIDNKVIIP